MAVAVIASISTPVLPVSEARAVARTASASNAKSTVTASSASGWHSGIRSLVFLAAMMPAIRATAIASPFLRVPPTIA